MSGTSGGLFQKSQSGIFLPEPRVELLQRDDVLTTTLEGHDVLISRAPMVHAMDIPQEFYKPQYGLQLELMWYRSNRKRASWSHPNCETTAHPAAKYRSGLHSPNGGTPRTTEWAVTAEGQQFVLHDIVRFMRYINVNYRESFGNNIAIDVLCPTYMGSEAAQLTLNAGWHYAKAYTPLYVAFRYSIIDTEATRYRRISGPMSKVVSVAHSDMPFMYDRAKSLVENAKCATINPRFDSKALTCYFETRLP